MAEFKVTVTTVEKVRKTYTHVVEAVDSAAATLLLCVHIEGELVDAKEHKVLDFKVEKTSVIPED